MFDYTIAARMARGPVRLYPKAPSGVTHVVPVQPWTPMVAGKDIHTAGHPVVGTGVVPLRPEHGASSAEEAIARLNRHGGLAVQVGERFHAFVPHGGLRVSHLGDGGELRFVDARVRAAKITPFRADEAPRTVFNHRPAPQAPRFEPAPGYEWMTWDAHQAVRFQEPAAILRYTRHSGESFDVPVWLDIDAKQATKWLGLRQQSYREAVDRAAARAVDTSESRFLQVDGRAADKEPYATALYRDARGNRHVASLRTFSKWEPGAPYRVRTDRVAVDGKAFDDQFAKVELVEHTPLLDGIAGGRNRYLPASGDPAKPRFIEKPIPHGELPTGGGPDDLNPYGIPLFGMPPL